MYFELERIECLLAKKLKQFRLESRIPSEEIAQMLEISEEELLAYESGQKSISAILLYQLSVVYNKAPQSFF